MESKQTHSSKNRKPEFIPNVSLKGKLLFILEVLSERLEEAISVLDWHLMLLHIFNGGYKANTLSRSFFADSALVGSPWIYKCCSYS